MRANTEIAMVIRHVGNSQLADFEIEGTVDSINKAFIRIMLTHSMSTRFDVCVARSLDEARGVSRSRKTGPTQIDEATLEDDYEKIRAEFEAEILAKGI